MMTETLEAVRLDRVRWDYVRERANNLSRVYSSPPIPVHEIAQQNGVNVVFSTFGEHTDKVAGYCDFSAARIYVNKNDSVGRQMFTMAHELGHWILHKEFVAHHPDEYKVLPRFQEAVSNNMEKEANCFAAELLVPEKLLFPVKGAPVSMLAQIFRVSRSMMENRIKNVRK